MPPEPPLCFGPYRLAGPHGPLWCGAQVVPLPPKALAVLWRLASQAGQVVTKEALLEAGWAGTVVSEGVLTTCLRLLRQALGEDAQQPRYIATVHRLGYRFVAPVTAGTPVTPPGPPLAPLAPPPLVVGRAAELAQLHAWFAQGRQGRRQTIFVTGEAGIGKTTLMETFLAEVAAAGTAWIGRGQCIEHYGEGEAYLPLLDALGRLGRGPGGPRLVACLRQYAPTWLVQLPGVVGEEERVAFRHQVQGATPHRMLRELAEALEALTAGQPLIIVLEDLHWSDASTIEALALLARRREAARLLVLGTYRPVELILRPHPLKMVKQELALHGHCAEVPLGYLNRAEVQAYLDQRVPATTATAELTAWVQRRTQGHPLFMVHVVDELARHGRLTAPTAAAEVPAGLQQLIELQLGQLGAEAQQVLEVASVVGAEFAEASVAAGLPLPLDAIEAIDEGLARQGQFIEDLGLVEWPDGTVSGRYGFRHALYREVLYERISSGRRLRCHRAIGVRLEAGYGAQASQIASALAVHFERGRDLSRAVRYRQQAADRALQRHAYREAIAHFTTALALLEALPDTPGRVQQEIELRIALGPALMAARGWAVPEVEQTYARARVLCAQVGETPQLFPALLGLSRFYLTRGPLSTARELGQQLDRLAQHEGTLTRRLEAHEALGDTLFFLGEFAAARMHLELGIALTDPATEQAEALRHGVAPGVRCLVIVANTLWSLGFPVQALRRAQDALALAQELAHPQSLAMAHHFVAFLHYHRREAVAVQGQAEALLTLAAAQEFPLWVGHGNCWRGWALAVQGQGEAGMALLHQGLAAVLATGQTLTQPLHLVLLAEAAGHSGRVEEGLRLLAEAQAACEGSGRGDMLAEAYRLRGELLLRQAAPAMAQAEACFHQALAIAQSQQAKSWELRGATSLSRLWQEQDRRGEARALFAPIYDWFTEGFDTADLHEAKALLEALGG
ncbi:MAG TPA: AAA family ATPase [Candidatus Tectomicrobia bacterium]|nr:AAA family ATPase [Candidatus Tectomicrobia bacterium]